MVKCVAMSMNKISVIGYQINVWVSPAVNPPTGPAPILINQEPEPENEATLFAVNLPVTDDIIRAPIGTVETHASLVGLLSMWTPLDP
jgi:hypothetical protein